MPKGESLIDIAKINETYFINVACTGLDAEVGNNIDILRKTKIPTSQLYNASIVYTFVNYKFKKIKIKTRIIIIRIHFQHSSIRFNMTFIKTRKKIVSSAIVSSLSKKIDLGV